MVTPATAAALLSAFLAAASPAPSPFTVADSIRMTRLVRAGVNDEVIISSPDGRSFAVVTRRGDPETDLNEYRLNLIDAEATRKLVNAPTSLPLPPLQPLVEFETSSPRDAIDRVRWIDEGSVLAFIGRGTDQIAQVYTFDLRTRNLRKLTDDAEGVGAFDIEPERQVLVFSAYATPDWERRNRHGYAVVHEPINYLGIRNPKDSFRELRYYIKHLDSGRVIPVAETSGVYPMDPAISPDGRKAIAWTKVVVRPEWFEYQFLEHYPRVAATQNGASSPSDPSTFLDNDALLSLWELEGSLGFSLIDLETGVVAPLLDAPSGNGVTPFSSVTWSADGTAAVLQSAFLPLDGLKEGDKERERRRSLAAIVEVDIATKAVSRVSDIPLNVMAGAESIEWPSTNTLLMQEYDAKSAKRTLRTYRKGKEGWGASGRAVPVGTRGIELIVAQDPNTPPEIVAIDHRSARRKAITDLNPELRNLSLGRAEPFSWTDRLGRELSAGLILPDGFQPGRRHPLVIQTHGFDPREFLVDGPRGVTTAYAARGLVARGIVVLQVNENQEPDGSVRPDNEGQPNWRERTESGRAVIAIEGAIDALEQRGMVDRHRVGLIAWSRSGLAALHALAFSPQTFAAVSISDSHAETPWLYALTYARGGMLEWESSQLIGAPFWGAGIAQWVERSPVFHLDRVRAPLRYEHLNTSYPPGLWDVFVNLRRHRRPAEMIHIPIATHSIQTPFARMTSQQGNVDWFVFWLKDEEDSDPSKATQYARWRKLRAEHQALIDN